MKKIFNSNEDTDLIARNGQNVEVIKELDKEVYHLEEVDEGEKVYLVRFPDGYECEVYEGELKGIKTKAILLSIHQRHWNNIKAGKKTYEIRKIEPRNIEYPFKVLCYVTGGVGIVGEFECDATTKTDLYHHFVGSSCLTLKELQDYGKGNWLCGWHVKEESVAIYGQPIPLINFGVTRAPQSWQYINL